MTIKITEPISALVSWGSYDYQGHIALYVSLVKIRELLETKINISSYKLQIEGIEDFALIKNDKYESLHQVKAGAINLSENDKFTFLIEILENDNAFGYYHINKSKKLPIDFVEKTYKHLDYLINELKKEIVYEKDINNEDNKNKFIVFEEIYKNHKKSDVYNIIKNFIKNTKININNIEDIKDIVSKITIKLGNYRNKIKQKVSAFKRNNKSANDDEAFLTVYKKKFNNIKEIKRESIEEINKILSLTRTQYTFLNKEYCEYVYDRLFLFLKKTITTFINSKKKDDKCILKFSKILETLQKNYHDEMNTVQYQFYQVLRAISNTFMDYPKEKQNGCKAETCSECYDKERCNLNIQIEELSKRTNEDKNKTIYNLILFEPEIGKNNNLPSDNMISDLLLNVLDEIDSIHLTDKHIFQTIRNNGDTYRLTLNDSRKKDEIQKKITDFVVKEIDKSLLYESDILITDRLNEKYLFFYGNNINVLNEKELNEIKNITNNDVEKLKNDCNRPKIIRLIDKNTALEELKK